MIAFFRSLAGPLVPEIAAFEIEFVGLAVLGRLGSDRTLLRTRELRLQRIGNRFRDFALDRKNVGQFPIECVRPKMSVRRRFDQLHVDADLVCRLLHAAFEDVCYAKLLCDLAADCPASF